MRLTWLQCRSDLTLSHVRQCTDFAPQPWIIAVLIRAARLQLQAIHGETTTIKLVLEHQNMKSIPEMKSPLLAHGFAVVLLAFELIVPVASANSDAIVQTAGGVSYVSGGIGTEAIDRLGSLAGDFNLKLVFALKTGSYLSGVKVTIADAAGKTLLDTMSEGPWLLAKLPVGKYHIVATFAGKAETRAVSVAAQQLKTVDFRWTSE